MISSIRNSVKRTISRSFTTSLIKANKEPVDPIQEALLNEKCFLVDENDKIIGQASKKECHLVQKNGDIPLHRAFSVYLFNKKGDFLLQKRSSSKIIYPKHYTHSCCEHPVANFFGEDEEKNEIGVKRAAIRRLIYELVVPENKMSVEKMQCITRIYYKDDGDGIWGDHEINYVIFSQVDLQIKPYIKPNPKEVSEINIVPRNEFDAHIPTLVGTFTP